MHRTIRTRHENLVGFGSFSIVREEQDKDLVKETTSVLTLFDEIVGLGGNDINSTTSLFEGRVGSVIGETELISSSTNEESKDNILSLVGITC